MRIACVGGGPGGLFLSVLLARTGRHTVEVFDRDAVNATYGFGVVFSRLSMARLRAIAPRLVQEVLAAAVRWQHVEVRYQGTSAISSGHDFIAVERTTLLDILRRHATAVGVRLFPSRAIDSIESLRDHDVIVAADGAGSTLRTQDAMHFQPAIAYSKTRYVWYGVNRRFPAMTFLLARGGEGLLAAHVYPYSSAASTFLIETSEDVWRRAGFTAQTSRPAAWTDPDALRYCQQVFAEELQGDVLIGNGSRWRAFGEVCNECWSHERVVLLGDAAHTAHFSVGSGTSMAMEDAAQLAHCLENYTRLEDAFAAYQAARQSVANRIQLAAWASSQFWERLQNESNREVGELLLRLLTRTGQTDIDLLLRADPALPSRVQRSLSAVPEGEAIAAVRLTDLPRSGPVAVLIRVDEVPAVSTHHSPSVEWSSMAIIVDPRTDPLPSIDRLARCLLGLRARAPGIPVGVHFSTGSGEPAQGICAALSDYAHRLAARATLDFVSVSCRGVGAVARTVQMSVCDFVKSELRLPTIYACERDADISHGWTHVQAARADRIWRIEGALC